jgi:uncharacterized membrane protein YedE/YeeE
MSGTGKKAAGLWSGLGFGIVFGFLLQKGGVAKFHVLVGQLLLEDFTVVKVMMSAVVVGMTGVFFMHRRGLVDLHVKPTRIGANIAGGLVFGAGFALSGYCPGTNLAALGQGNFDALFVAAGMVIGSYLFAEVSAVIDRTIGGWGDRGELMLPELLRLPRKLVVPALALALVALLAWLEQVTVR